MIRRFLHCFVQWSVFCQFVDPSSLETVQLSLQTLLFFVSFLCRLFHGTIALTMYLTVFLPCFLSTIIKYGSFILSLDKFRQLFFGISARSKLSVAFLRAFREFRVDLCLPDFLCFLNLISANKPFNSRTLVTSALKAAIQKQSVS